MRAQLENPISSLTAPNADDDRSACVRVVFFFFFSRSFRKCLHASRFREQISRRRRNCVDEMFRVARAGKPACDFTRARDTKEAGKLYADETWRNSPVKGVNTLREGRACRRNCFSVIVPTEFSRRGGTSSIKCLDYCARVN